MIRELFVFGVGGLSKEVTQLIEHINLVARDTYNIAAYVLTIHVTEPLFRGKKVISEQTFLERLEKNGEAHVVIAIGTPSVRQTIVNRLNNYNIHYPCLIHPSSKLDPSVSMKEGVTICANVTSTVDISIGRHTYINFGCTIAHDVQIGDFVQINPLSSISGRVKIGNNCLIGAGSIIHENTKIGDGCTVGIGSVVLQDLKPNTTVFCNPARQLPLRKDIQND